MQRPVSWDLVAEKNLWSLTGFEPGFGHFQKVSFGIGSGLGNSGNLHTDSAILKDKI